MWTEYATIFFIFSQTKQFAKKFRKSNRQYLKNQQTVFSSPVSPYQTVLKFLEIHARQFNFLAFYSPLQSHENLNAFSFQAQSLLLANTRHTLENGMLKEHYDIPSMERKILDRYLIYSCPAFRLEY